MVTAGAVTVVTTVTVMSVIAVMVTHNTYSMMVMPVTRVVMVTVSVPMAVTVSVTITITVTVMMTGFRGPAMVGIGVVFLHEQRITCGSPGIAILHAAGLPTDVGTRVGVSQGMPKVYRPRIAINIDVHMDKFRINKYSTLK